MKKNFKTACISLLAVMSVAAFGGSATAALANGEENETLTSLVTDANFKMLDGAGVRLDEEKNGLRFSAEIGSTVDENSSYYTLIVPNTYLTKFDIDIADTTNYYEELCEALEEYDRENGTNTVDSLAVMACKPFTVDTDTDLYKAGTYYIRGSLTDIRFANSNVDFFGISFYIDGDTKEYTYAKSTADNLRSITEVASKAYGDGTSYVDENKILKKYISNGINDYLDRPQETVVDFANLAEGSLAEFDLNETKDVSVDLPDTIPVAYESASDEIASVSKDGVITAVAKGSTTVTVKVLGTVAEYEVKVWDIANDSELADVNAKLAEYNSSFVGVCPTNIHAQTATVSQLDGEINALGAYRASKLSNYDEYLENKSTFVLFEDYSDISGKFSNTVSGGFSNADNGMTYSNYGTVANVGCAPTNDYSIFKYNKRETVNYGSCEYVQFVVVNQRHNSNLVVKFRIDDWGAMVAQSESIAYGEESLVTVKVSDFKSTWIHGNFDATASNGTNFLMTAMYAVSPSKTTVNVINAIDAIGDVTVDSRAAIASARSAYDALTMQKELVTNYAKLQQAEKTYAELAREQYVTEAVTSLEAKISAFNSATLSPSTVKQLTADKATIDAAYAALSENEKSIVIDYDKYLEKKSSFVIFEDYSNASTVFSGAHGYTGVIADNRTNVSEYGICASLGMNPNNKFFYVYYNLSKIPSGYKYISFAVKNTRSANLKLYLEKQGIVLLESAKTGEWTVVTMSIDDFCRDYSDVDSNNGRFTFSFAETYSSGDTNVWFSPMYAHN